MTAAATPPVVHARAPGKINVFMKVGSLLDDGYHDVATAYQAISLYEEVFARDADDFSVRFRGPIDTAGLTPFVMTNASFESTSMSLSNSFA